jgi:hypothetical protein
MHTFPPKSHGRVTGIPPRLRSSSSYILHTISPPNLGPRGGVDQGSHPPTCQHNTGARRTTRSLTISMLTKTSLLHSYKLPVLANFGTTQTTWRTLPRHPTQRQYPSTRLTTSSCDRVKRNTVSTRAYVCWTVGVQNVGTGRPCAWRYSSHTSVSIACVLHIIASQVSAQIRGAVSVHQGSLIRKAPQYVWRACMDVVCCSDCTWMWSSTVGTQSRSMQCAVMKVIAIGVHSAGHP